MKEVREDRFYCQQHAQRTRFNEYNLQECEEVRLEEYEDRVSPRKESSSRDWKLLEGAICLALLSDASTANERMDTEYLITPRPLQPETLGYPRSAFYR